MVFWPVGGQADEEAPGAACGTSAKALQSRSRAAASFAGWGLTGVAAGPRGAEV